MEYLPGSFGVLWLVHMNSAGCMLAIFRTRCSKSRQALMATWKRPKFPVLRLQSFSVAWRHLKVNTSIVTIDSCLYLFLLPNSITFHHWELQAANPGPRDICVYFDTAAWVHFNGWLLFWLVDDANRWKKNETGIITLPPEHSRHTHSTRSWKNQEIWRNVQSYLQIYRLTSIFWWYSTQWEHFPIMWCMIILDSFISFTLTSWNASYPDSRRRSNGLLKALYWLPVIGLQRWCRMSWNLSFCTQEVFSSEFAKLANVGNLQIPIPLQSYPIQSSFCHIHRTFWLLGQVRNVVWGNSPHDFFDCRADWSRRTKHSSTHELCRAHCVQHGAVEHAKHFAALNVMHWVV